MKYLLEMKGKEAYFFIGYVYTIKEIHYNFTMVEIHVKMFIKIEGKEENHGKRAYCYYRWK
ncbi:hypothetical protein [Clostridium formicaceticum]|uniref:Uncharacterized protein n=2 Tax=Clostridium formicaceticum TaxID=1497 RepID=A0AAC9RK78_9CLOT|nr:hypothetical protein [Clostridium formicaceticum]AOY76709.1 hypothetical protein BJL90_13030 [Clostridium formicaceticum]ARE87144.1 hypothetical protein CLFO_15310 [Clostridium formicaceticum]